MPRTPLRTARENVAANLDPLDVARHMLTATAHLIDDIERQVRDATGDPTLARRIARRIAGRVADRMADVRTLTIELKQAHNDLIRTIRTAENRLPEDHR